MLSTTVSSAELIPGKNVRLLVLNEVEPESTVEPVALNDGFTQVVVKVSARVGKGSSKKVFDSAPFIMSFEATGQDVTIIAPRLTNYERANKQFKGVPDMKLVDSNGDVQYHYQKLEGKKGFMPYLDVDKLVMAYNEKNGIYFGNSTNLAAKAQVASTSSTVVTGAINESKEGYTESALSHTNNLEQLKAWYLKAQKTERKAFKKWMIDQE